jgi:hypothetical protein
MTLVDLLPDERVARLDADSQARRQDNPLLSDEHMRLERRLGDLAIGLHPDELRCLVEAATAMLVQRGAHVPSEDRYVVPDGGPDDHAGQAAKARIMARRR